MSAAVLTLWIVAALIGPVLAPHGEAELLVNDSFSPAGAVGLLGGDYLGRDILSRLLYGARRTLGLATLVTMGGFVLGVASGFLAASAGGWTDAVAQFHAHLGDRTGFKFAPYTAAVLVEAVHRAILLHKQPKKWQKLMRNAMACGFLWQAGPDQIGGSVKEYEKLYAAQ